jgi:hypothetical protein
MRFISNEIFSAASDAIRSDGHSPLAQTWHIPPAIERAQRAIKTKKRHASRRRLTCQASDLTARDIHGEQRLYKWECNKHSMPSCCYEMREVHSRSSVGWLPHLRPTNILRPKYSLHSLFTTRWSQYSQIKLRYIPV